MADSTNPNPQQSKSQNQRILEYLQTGKTLTPLDALELFNCFALSSRISNLVKAGHNIKSELVKVGDKKVSRYSYVQPVVIELPLNELK